MSLYNKFVEILIPTELIKIAEFHSEKRTKLIANQTVLIIGFVNQSSIKEKKPCLYTPKSPTGKRRKYNSENFIFHHSEVTSIKELI